MNLETLRELVEGLAAPVVLGIVAYLVRVCRFGVKTWRQFVSGAVVSVFVAVLVFWGLDAFDLPPTVDAAIVGFASYLGTRLLDAAQARAIRDVTRASAPGREEG